MPSDPQNLPRSDPSKMNFGSGGNAEEKAWRDFWSAGHHVGQIERVMAAAEVVADLRREFAAARAALCA